MLYRKRYSEAAKSINTTSNKNLQQNTFIHII